MKMESPGSFTGAYYVSSVCDLRDESLYIGRGSHWQPPQKGMQHQSVMHGHQSWQHQQRIKSFHQPNWSADNVTEPTLDASAAAKPLTYDTARPPPSVV